MEWCCGNAVANFIAHILPDKGQQTVIGHSLENFKNVIHKGEGLALKVKSKPAREFKSRPKDFIGQVEMITKRIIGFIKELKSATAVAYDEEVFKALELGKQKAGKDRGIQEYIISNGEKEIRFSAREAREYIPNKITKLNRAATFEKPKEASFAAKVKQEKNKKETILLDPAAIVQGKELSV